MSKGERRYIFVLLIIIAISSIYLISKINNSPKYNSKIYERVYSEYEEIDDEISENENTESDIIDNSEEKNKNVIYRHASVSNNGTYIIDGKITIPKIHISYPIVYETTDEYLKVAPTKLAGPNMNEVGNYCIAGHNYKNDQFFSKLSQLELNDKIFLTSNDGEAMAYTVYDKYEVNEKDLSCINQETNGKVEVTLITCTKLRQNRLIIKCKALG